MNRKIFSVVALIAGFAAVYSARAQTLSADFDLKTPAGILAQAGADAKSQPNVQGAAVQLASLSSPRAAARAGIQCLARQRLRHGASIIWGDPASTCEAAANSALRKCQVLNNGICSLETCLDNACPQYPHW